MKTWILALAVVLLPGSALAQPQAVIEALRAARAAKPTPMTKAQNADLLNRVVSQFPGWAMLRKDAGNNCPSAYPGVSISCDYLVNVASSWGYDVLSDQENSAVVVQSGGVALAAGQEVVYAWPTESAPSAPGGPTPPAGQAPTAGFDAQRLEDNIVQRTANLIVDVQAQLERMFGCRDGRSPAGEPCATAQDNADAIRGVSRQVKEHDEKTSGLVAFLKDGKTISAAVTFLTTWVALRQTGK
ncbi:MAG TPA: hypothetical protein PKZ07_16110 [Sedimentisphaerales bacterium]|mgnify:CR=1 FL=1|nr:hypothetical protein [Sedimentisphaerales bacterium]